MWKFADKFKNFKFCELQSKQVLQRSEKLLIDESLWRAKSHKEKQKQFENLATEPADGFIR